MFFFQFEPSPGEAAGTLDKTSVHAFDPTATLNTLGEAFFAVDGDWRFTFVNREAERQWNRPAASLLGKNMWEEFPALTGSSFEPVYREVAETRVPRRLRSYAPTNGRWYEVRVFPSDGGLAAFYTDATDLKLAEEALARVSAISESDRRMYQTVLSNSADLHYVLDTEGRFRYASPSLLELYGRPEHEVVGHNLAEMGRTDEVSKTFMEQVRHVATTGEPVRHETPNQDRFAGRTFEYILMPVFDASGKVEAIAGSSRDTTKRRATELAVIEEARRKDEFIATLAHELRNPLAPIRNALEVARLAKGNDVAVEYAHGVMDRQMTHMVRLIDDLLDLSRLNLGRIELKRATFDLASVLDTAMETSRPHIQQAEITLTVDLPKQTVCVDADSDRLVQVFANLLTNAAKFTPRGGRVMLSLQQEDGTAVVRVKDTGIGMSAEILEHVFDSFTQEGDALNRTEGGLGIGLTLVKGLVELHGGTVEAHSDGKGLGSEVIVRLPVSTNASSSEPRRTRRTSTTVTNWHRILVVDDNKDSATSLSMMLNFMGHDTRTANDGLRGLEVAEQFRPDVCLLDIGMPNLNGYDMARRLRDESWGKDILLIALSGWGQEHDKERSSNAGFDLHLVKPIDPATLGAVLEARRPALRV